MSPPELDSPPASGEPLLALDNESPPLVPIQEHSVLSGRQGTALGEEVSEKSMGQNNSVQTSAQLERLQEQLKASVARSEVGSIRSLRVEEQEDENDGILFMAKRERSRSTSNDSRKLQGGGGGGGGGGGSPSQGNKGKGKARPVSALLPAPSTWAEQLSHIAFPSRKSLESLQPTTRSPSQKTTQSPKSSSSTYPPVFDSKRTTPPRRTSSTSSLKLGRRSPKPSPTASLRQTMRLPFLPSIPASPLPPILSPGMTRSASSPPILPTIPATSSISPTLELTPPSAGLAPSQRSWPDNTTTSITTMPPPILTRTGTSASVPNLSLLASAPIDSDSPTLTHISLPGSLPASTHSATESLTFDPELLIPDSPIVSLSPTEDKLDAKMKRDERRYHALIELVDTESGYLEHLRALVKVYFQTLPFLTLLSASEVEAVVRNAEALLELHERIADRLEEVERELSWRGEEEEGEVQQSKKHWKVRKAAQKIAKVFVDELPNFHLYNDFCSRHAEAMDITRRLTTRPEWEAYERQCAQRVASQGDSTPLASRTNSASASPFFPTVALPALSTSLPTSSPSVAQTASPTDSPTTSTLHLPISSSYPASASSLASRSRAKLRFTDFAIAPVQRIMRYPMVFGSLAKYCEEESIGDGDNEVKSALTGLKRVAEAVDEAKREREGEIRTRIVANRMEFQSTVSMAFCDILGPTILVGALHVLHRSTTIETLRVKYYGCFLYRSHLILAKIKKRASYEPREWLPLRLFEITPLEEGQGLLSQSIRLACQDHVLELGALCATEKAIWLNRLTKAQTEARRQWEEQARDEHGNPTLFDDTLISSVSPVTTTPSSATPVRKSHSRSTSSVSVTSVLAAAAASSSNSNSPFIPQDEPLPSLPIDSTYLINAHPLAPVSSNPTSTLSNRNRFSTTASSLLGRTPSAQRAAVDLRLADVFSEECLAARAQAAREAVEFDESGRRLRTMSGPKRSMTAGFSGSGASSVSSMTGKMLSAKDRRRMSSFELELGRGPVGDFRGAIGFDASVASLYRDDAASSTSTINASATTPERKWASAIRKTKSAGSRARPALPEIDTALAEAMNKKVIGTRGEKQAPLTASASGTGSWRSKGASDLRRVASHSSLDRPGRHSTAFGGGGQPPIVASAAVKAESSAADVERNNSVSSSTSSNGTATNSSSSHSQGLHLIETPPSSIPPSPDICPQELLDPVFPPPGSSSLKPSLSTKSASPRFHSIQDGVSSVFRIKRRKSTLGLAPVVTIEDRPSPPPHTRSSTSTSSNSASSQHSNSESSSTTAGAKLSRRSSTIGGYFQKRVQSSPTLTGFFASALGSTSSPHLPLTFNPAHHSSPPASIGVASNQTSPSSTTFHTPTSIPTTPELGAAAEFSSHEPQTPSIPSQTQTTPRKKLASKVASTFQNMGRSRSSEGSTSSPSSGSVLASRRFAFKSSMTPLER
ncbi:hypothetical protein JCM5353_006840 [Sporobolomyces roseus]